ncbi:MAG: DNA recombination/repair protein RecA, partial [Acidobacteriota bacterium]|nr:DNA recombination/repair protein RecA [Acidobacteriota bacterium]
VAHRVVDKSGSWFSYGDLRLGQGRENARRFLKDNPDLASEIENKLRMELGLVAKPAVQKSEDQGETADPPEATTTPKSATPPQSRRGGSSGRSTARPGVPSTNV